MDGGLLQKQSKQVINMTMGTRTEVSNKDAGEEGGGWRWRGGACGRRVVGGRRGGGRDNKVGKTRKKEAREQKTLMCCEILSPVPAEPGQITLVRGVGVN